MRGEGVRSKQQRAKVGGDNRSDWFDLLTLNSIPEHQHDLLFV